MKAKRPPAKRTEPPHSMPGGYALLVADVAARWGVPPSELLSEVGLTREALEEPALRVPLADYERLIDRACRVTGEPGLGVYLGLQGRISAHGYLGFAAMTASTLREAIEIAARYVPTRTTAIGLRLEVVDADAAIVIEEHAPLGRARETIIIALAIGIWRIGNSITGRELVGGADFAFPPPAFSLRLTSLVSAPGRVLYDQPQHRVIFGAEQLDFPIMLSDSVASRLALKQCEQELDALSKERRLASQVSGRIVDSRGSVRSLESIARELSMSVRTLKRKLAEEGSSYSMLLEERRRLRALQLLRSELSIEQIADRLGYSDAANFTRAFRRWTGKTPREFRLRH